MYCHWGWCNDCVHTVRFNALIMTPHNSHTQPNRRIQRVLYLHVHFKPPPTSPSERLSLEVLTEWRCAEWAE